MGGNPRDPKLHATNEGSPQVSRNDFVDLTNDSDNDSDVQVVFPKSKSVVSSETEDGDEDEQLQRALAMSMEPSDHANTETVKTAANITVPLAENVVSTGTLSSMNRKQMEEERLARLAKRKLDDTSASTQPSRKLPKTQPVIVSRARTKSTAPQPRSEICHQLASNAPSVGIHPTSRSVPQWPLGAVKKTHIAGFPRTGNEITIEEVIQRDDLDLGVFSSFLWDLEWFFTKINTQSSRILLIMQANDQETVPKQDPITTRTID